MSTVFSTINPTEFMTGWLGTLTHFFIRDIEAIPADKLGVSPGGKARSPQSIAGEVISLLDWMTETLKGGSPPAAEGDAAEKLAATLTTPAVIVARMQEASASLRAAIESAPNEIWTKMVLPPWQLEAPCFVITNIVINHIWYHDGQLNTIHMLSGDEKVHWME